MAWRTGCSNLFSYDEIAAEEVPINEGWTSYAKHTYTAGSDSGVQDRRETMKRNIVSFAVVLVLLASRLVATLELSF